jgi:hypothetical protein
MQLVSMLALTLVIAAVNAASRRGPVGEPRSGAFAGDGCAGSQACNRPVVAVSSRGLPVRELCEQGQLSGRIGIAGCGGARTCSSVGCATISSRLPQPGRA